MIDVPITAHDGAIVNVPVDHADTLMIALRDAGLPVQGLCGGNGICSTCHILVEQDIYAALPEPDEDELDTLVDLDTYIAGASRLACQLPVAILPPGFHAVLAPER